MNVRVVLDQQASNLLAHSIRQTRSQSAVVFLCDRTRTAPSLHRLYAHGIPMAALQDYSAAGIFTHDPFLSQEVVRRRVGEKGWLVVESNDCEVREDMCASEYWAFLSRYKIGVGGAIIKPITSDVFLVGALHGDYRPSDASIATVADEMGGVLDCAASRLMSVAIGALDQGNEISTVDALNGLVDRYRLSERDSAIVSLVKSGLLNKQIAHELSIPDYTVENHLRRIYRKLGVHNRSALLSLMFSRA